MGVVKLLVDFGTEIVSRGSYFCNPNGKSLSLIPTETIKIPQNYYSMQLLGLQDARITTESPQYMAGILLFMKIFRQEHETESSAKDAPLVCYMMSMHDRWECFIKDVDQKVKELKVGNEEEDIPIKRTKLDEMSGDGAKAD